MLGRLPSFDYYRPTTLDDTLKAMERLDGNYCFLAGGTDLLVAMKEHRGTHPALLDLKAVPKLGAISADNGSIYLGATATTRAIYRAPLVRERLPLLCQSLTLLGSMQIGNRATIGGNLSNASPAADSAPPLLALGASVKLVGIAKERWVALDKFFVGPKKTVIDGEMLVEVRIPTNAVGRGVFLKLGARNAPEDIGIASAAVYGVPDGETQTWKELRIALGAVAPTPIRARHAEDWLKRQPLEPILIEEAAQIAADQDAQPISDNRASAEYRRAMVQVLVKRALERIAGRDKGATSV